MPSRIKYSFGDILNESTGTQFLEEIEVEKGKPRKARCKCGYCGNEDFIITIKKAKAGQLCSLCKSERISNRQFISYEYGQILNQKTKSVYLRDAGFNSSNQRMAKIKCGYCGNEYEAAINNVKNGSLCPKCRNQRAGAAISEVSKTYKVGEIIENCYGIKYLIVDDFYNERKIRKCIFAPLDKNGNPILEDKFESVIHSVLYGLTSGKRKISSLELSVSNYFDRNNISYTFQKTFEDLLSNNNYHMYYDFAIPLRCSQTLLIEVDGEQHFHPVSVFGGEASFKTQKERDKLKEEYVDKRPNLFLERIPYYDFIHIEDILENLCRYYNIIKGV